MCVSIGGNPLQQSVLEYSDLAWSTAPIHSVTEASLVCINESAIKLQSDGMCQGEWLNHSSRQARRSKSKKKKTGSRCQECSEEITIKGLLSAGTMARSTGIGPDATPTLFMEEHPSLSKG
ncbi:hypothetical protein CEXT_373021 [Caerostris extrusa]|uniref:Uncharacterized protein n=1 Tax=Caerostris extrusa TaxID=172846 RepID=A0AAV4UBU9_CAEEX|nr:hypothetical protein CEXT_373021 [Caerostris extrusa]